MSGKRGVWVPLKGVHKVRRKLADGTCRIHYYAWRGGPKLDPEDLEGSYHRLTTERKEKLARQRSNTVAACLAQFQSSPAFQDRAPAYQKDTLRLHRIIADAFGGAGISIMEDPRFRGEVYKLRDQYKDRPRFADLLTGEITTIANWLYEQGRIKAHSAAKFKKLHSTNRAEIIWEPHELDAVCSALSPHNAAVVRVAAGTGLDLPDLLSLTWTQIRRFSIETRRAKTGELALPILLPAVTEVLDDLDRRAVHGSDVVRLHDVSPIKVGNRALRPLDAKFGGIVQPGLHGDLDSTLPHQRHFCCVWHRNVIARIKLDQLAMGRGCLKTKRRFQGFSAQPIFSIVPHSEATT